VLGDPGGVLPYVVLIELGLHLIAYGYTKSTGGASLSTVAAHDLSIFVALVISVATKLVLS